MTRSEAVTEEVAKNGHAQSNTETMGPSMAAVDYFSLLKAYRRIILLTDGCSTPALAKTAINLLRYRTGDIAAILDADHNGQSAVELFSVGGAIPVVGRIDDVAEADALFLGTAPPGGELPDRWKSIISSAIERGLDIVSGLHDLLEDNQEFNALARGRGTRLIDVRRLPHRRIAGNVPFRPDCLRIHTVGHDCSVGKMVAAVEVATALCDAGLDAQFVATGQTGIMISGAGIAVDGIVADFVNGAAEQLVLDNQHHDILLIEGQGSLDHPSFSSVTLGLLHGCRPDGLILCYEAGRSVFKSIPDTSLHPLQEIRRLNEMMASLRTPCQVIGVAMNSRRISAAAADEERRRVEQELCLPVCDVYRHGPQALSDAVIRLGEQLGRLPSRRVDDEHNGARVRPYSRMRLASNASTV